MSTNAGAEKGSGDQHDDRHGTAASGDDRAAGAAGAPADDHVEQAGAFDIRNFIAALLGLYGVILVVWGLLTHSPADAAKTGGVNANLWTGIAMAVAAVLFVVWAKAAPIRVEVHRDASGEKELEAAD